MLFLKIMVGAAFLLIPDVLMAQGVAASTLPPLTGPQMKTLLLIARESLDASFEGRSARQATVEPRLEVPQPLVASVYVDGKLRARSWRLKPYQPLFLDARDIVFEALNNPRGGGSALTVEELARASLSLAVLSSYIRVEDDRDIPPRTAVIILSGFTEAVGLPSDIKTENPADLLNLSAERAGLRPHIWLLPETAKFFARLDGYLEEQGR